MSVSPSVCPAFDNISSAEANLCARSRTIKDSTSLINEIMLLDLPYKIHDFISWKRGGIHVLWTNSSIVFIVLIV